MSMLTLQCTTTLFVDNEMNYIMEDFTICSGGDGETTLSDCQHLDDQLEPLERLEVEVDQGSYWTRHQLSAPDLGLSFECVDGRFDATSRVSHWVFTLEDSC